MASYTARLGHVNLKVRDPERSARFYRDLLGFDVRERVRDEYVFMSGSDFHHELALKRVGSDAPDPPAHAVGLYHVAFELPDRPAFAAVYRKLEDAGVAVRAVDHGISWAMYLADPDGNTLEIYRDTRSEPGGRDRWGGESRPLGREEILRS